MTGSRAEANGRGRRKALLLFLLFAALATFRAEASRTSVWESNPHAAAVLARPDAAAALASVAPAADADAEITEALRFNLGDVVLVERELGSEERFGLGPLDLLGPAPLRGPPRSYPETRVRGFELLPPFRVGASPTLSLWSHQACGFSCLGPVSDGPQDPWGLQSADVPIDEALRRASAKAAAKTARDFEEADGFWGRVGRSWDRFWDTAGDWWSGTVNDTAVAASRPLETVDDFNRSVARQAGGAARDLTEGAFPIPQGESSGARQARAVGLGNQNVGGAGGSALASGLRRDAGDINERGAQSATYVALGTLEAEGAGRLAAATESVELAKTPRGPGAVPPGARDPKRVWTRGEKQNVLDARGGKCEACDAPIRIEEAKGHHKKRHADGGQTTKDNLALLCPDCHKEIHAP